MSARTLLRFDLLDGTTKWRPLIDLEHGTLCTQAGIDPASYVFDLPSSARGVGSASSGAGGLRGGRRISGYILHGRTREPIGTVTFCDEHEKFRDVDPTDRREALRLG